MSTATPDSDTRRATAPLLGLPRPSMARLLGVELRKSLDTRASRWFVTAVALLAVAAAVYPLAGGVKDQPVVTVRLFTTSWEVVQMLLPVLGVLAMTSEWSQRTALVTFALVPRRLRVLVSKLGGVLLTSVAAVALTAVVAVAVGVAAGLLTGDTVQWTGLTRHVLGALVGGVCFMAMGAALGVLLQQTASALVAYFVAPTLVTLAATALVDDQAEWIAPTVAISRLSDLDLDGAVAPSIVALVLWIVLPLVLGAVRWLRREVS